MIGAEQNATNDTPQRGPAVFHGALAIAVGAATTAALWFGFAGAPVVGAEDTLVRGVLCALALWLLATAHARNASASRLDLERLQAAQADTSMLGPSSVAGAGPPIGWLRPAPVALGALALAGALALRFAPIVQQMVTPADMRLLGAGAVGAVWILAIGAAFGWWRATVRRLRREGAEGNADLAQAAMGRLPVMISLCAPDGRRLACNDRFTEVFKRATEDLEEGKWIEFVHQSDRSSFDAVFERDPGGFSPVCVEYGVATPGGDNRWIREQFLPERLHGVLHGYIAVGVDITNQVRNEAEYVEQLDALKEAAEKHGLVVGRLEEERDAARRENDELKANLRSESQRARQRGESLEKAREQRDKAKAESKELRAERTALKSETRRLADTNARIEKELDESRAELVRLTELQAEQAERVAQYKAEAEESRRQESQLRAKVKRLTEEAQRQAEQIDALTRARDDAEAAAHDLNDRFETEIADASRTALGSVRVRAEAATEGLARAIAGAPGDADLDALESSLAIIESISAMAGDAFSGAASSPARPEPGRERDFDLRALVRDAAKIAEMVAGEGGPRIHAEVEADFPASVYGDSHRLRAAILHMGSLLAGLPDADAITLRLEHFGALPSMVSVRIEFVVHGDSFDADAVGQAIAPGGDASAEAVAAWRRFAAMGGEQGAEAADAKTLTLWLKTSLMRRTAAASERPMASAPIAPAAPAEDDLPPLSQAARESQPPPQTEPPRIPQEDHECSLGQVLELGQMSARIRTTRSVSGGVVVRFTGADGKQVEVAAQVESSKKAGPRRYDTLLRYPDLAEATKAQLRKIAMMNRRLTTFVSRDEPAA